jgi:hypothetical protein
MRLVGQSHELVEIELKQNVVRDNTSCRRKKRAECSPLHSKSVTTSTIHSLCANRQDLNAKTIPFQLILKNYLSKLKKSLLAFISFVVFPSSHHRQRFFTGRQKSGNNFSSLKIGG